jgi:hypothetical protein
MSKLDMKSPAQRRKIANSPAKSVIGSQVSLGSSVRLRHAPSANRTLSFRRIAATISSAIFEGMETAARRICAQHHRPPSS